MPAHTPAERAKNIRPGLRQARRLRALNPDVAPANLVDELVNIRGPVPGGTFRGIPVEELPVQKLPEQIAFETQRRVVGPDGRVNGRRSASRGFGVL